MVFGLVLLVFGFIVQLKFSGCGFWFYFVFCLILFLSQVVVVGLAVVKIFRLWLSVLLWLKFSGYGFGVLFFVFFVRLRSLVFSLAEVFRLWSLVLFSIFLVLLFVFIRLLYVVLFPLFCCAVVCCFVRLWSLVLFSLSVLSGGASLCKAVVFGLAFCRAVVFVLVLFLFNFWYGYAVAEALRLWSLVLFLLSLLSGVAVLLRTRLLFVYFFLFRLLSVSSIFSCGVFLACAFCLCHVVRVELPVFFVRSRFVIIFRLCFWFCVFCLFLLCLKFSGCDFLSSVCSFCLVAVLLKIRSMLVYFYFVFRLWSCSFVFVWCFCLVG